MSFEMKDGSGTLFRNKKKETDSHPFWTGDAMWKGEKVQLSGWIKQDKNGNEFISLSLKPPFVSNGEQRRAEAVRPDPQSPNLGGFADDDFPQF